MLKAKTDQFLENSLRELPRLLSAGSQHLSSCLSRPALNQGLGFDRD
jgi:hypothetical protein